MHGVTALKVAVCFKTVKPLTLVLAQTFDVSAVALPQFWMNKVGELEQWVVPVRRAFSYPGIA